MARPPAYRNQHYATPALKELTAHWYAKLKEARFDEDGHLDPDGEPFVDLDPNNSLDAYPGSTFDRDMVLTDEDCIGCNRCHKGVRSKDGQRCRILINRFVQFEPNKVTANGGELDDIERQMEANAQAFGTPTNLVDTPTASVWRLLSQTANDLPPDYKHRGLLIDVTQVGCLAQYLLTRHSLTKEAARWAWDKFLAEAGMSHYRTLLITGRVRERK